MATNKLTTRDLIGTLIELEIDKEYLQMQSDPDDNPNEERLQSDIVKLDESITKVKSEIAKKTSGIDYMIVEMNRKKDILKAEITSYMDEIKRLRARQNAIKRTEDYFNKNLLPMIIETAGNDGVFETETTRYKLYETWGPLEVIDEDAVNDQYKRYMVEIDKKGARNSIIEAAENGLGISGFKIEKVKRVRRS